MAKIKSKPFLPKRIAGVKVPKSVRKGPLGQLLASRTGQALLGEAIVTAGAVDVANQRKYDVRRHDSQDMGPIGPTIAYALGEAARAYVRSLNERQNPKTAEAS